MRKRNKKGKIFSRPKNQRRALLKSLATSLFLHGKIKTTEVKAKELKSEAEQFITRAKRNLLTDRRIVAKTLSPNVAKKLFEEIAPQYNERKGGYTRIIGLGQRKSDGAKMAVIELIHPVK